MGINHQPASFEELKAQMGSHSNHVIDTLISYGKSTGISLDTLKEGFSGH
jgi:hypothetical protein